MQTASESPSAPEHSTRRIRTAAVTTLGCRLNQAESYQVLVQLAECGVNVVPFGEPADLTIVNTCTVTHVADQQGRQLLRRARRASPDGLVVAMGCYAQIAPNEVRRVEGVDVVIASGKSGLVPQLRALGLAIGGATSDEQEASWRSGPDVLPATRVRHFVKVQDGCDDYCTYCIVPFARGHAVSLSPDEIVAEVQELEDRGCREVVLTGVQIGAFGRDRYAQRGQPLPPPGEPLAGLVRRILRETTIARVRISSIQPQDWPPDFLELFGDPRLCPHLHLPLQSGCDAVLKRMGRRYSTSDFARFVERIRARVPDVAITADLIAGFPGETDADHRASVGFVRAMEFADAHVFRFSARRGTAASRMRDQVGMDVRKARSEELRAVSANNAERFRRRFLGTARRVLVEEELTVDAACSNGRRRWSGLTDNYLRVEIESPGDFLGRELPVRLRDLSRAGFVGEVATDEEDVAHG
ncbi:MAG TPA: tRNA (N(6)-L-threonylcarbamoyladenosine(37)-C(2))-methylthiotransferase MtaB [Chloroflexota bacterium]|nr:tRNA (N(6)-L-threonylcarbamoyladenosine(37)-C(2))-methylthiotransferase MtaB [Chloroflexota bacterium]